MSFFIGFWTSKIMDLNRKKLMSNGIQYFLICKWNAHKRLISKLNCVPTFHKRLHRFAYCLPPSVAVNHKHGFTCSHCSALGGLQLCYVKSFYLSFAWIHTHSCLSCSLLMLLLHNRRHCLVLIVVCYLSLHEVLRLICCYF